MDEAREEREELAALEREAADELRELDSYDPVGSGYALDDPKYPDAARWA